MVIPLDTTNVYGMPIHIDLSHKMKPGMQVYPGANGFRMLPAATIPKNGYNASEIAFSRTGTHIEVPYQFTKDGMTVDEIPFSMLTGPALVVDLTYKRPQEGIDWADLAPYQHLMKPGPVYTRAGTSTTILPSILNTYIWNRMRQK